MRGGATAGDVWLPAAVRPDGIVLLEEALERVGPADSPTRARLLTKLAQESYFADDVDHVIELHRETMDMARRLDDPGALSYALGFFADYNPLENPEEWATNPREAIALGERAHDAAAIQNARMALMWNLTEMGVMDEFDAQLDAAVALAAAVHLPLYA